MAENGKMTEAEAETLFRRVYDLTWNDLTAYVIAHIRNPDAAKDVLQTVYLALWKRIKKRGTLPDGECLPYLKTAAKHEIGRHFGYIADYSTVELSDDGFGDEVLIAGDSPEEECCDRETCREIFDDLRAGDELTYKIFLMRYNLCLSSEEIAEVLGISRAAVANRISRMTAKLREKYRSNV